MKVKSRWKKKHIIVYARRSSPYHKYLVRFLKKLNHYQNGDISVRLYNLEFESFADFDTHIGMFTRGEVEYRIPAERFFDNEDKLPPKLPPRRIIL